MSTCIAVKYPVKLNNKRSFKSAIILIPVTAFKCKECGETDMDIAEKYCGNPGCKYKK